MKYILISILSTTLLFSSCYRISDSVVEPKTEQQDANFNQKCDTIKNKNSTNSTKKIETEKSSIVEQIRYYWWAMGVLLAIECVMAYFLYTGYKRLKKVERKNYDRKEEIEALDRRMKKYHTDILQQYATDIRSIQEIQSSLTGRVYQLEKNIPSSKRQANIEVAPIYKTIYLGTVKGNNGNCFFNDTYYSIQDECVFKATLMNNIEAEFEPLEINRFRSITDIRQAIDYDSTHVVLGNANGFSIKRKGLIRKENEIWKIVRRVEIILS